MMGSCSQEGYDMALVQLTIQNFGTDAINLPPVMGGYEIAASATKAITTNPDRLNVKSLADQLKTLTRQVFQRDEDTDVDAAGNIDYTLQAKVLRVIEGSLVVTVPLAAGGSIDYLDDGLGALAEDGGGTGVGTVNYDTGAITITAGTTAPTNAIAASGDIIMSYNSQGVTVTPATSAVLPGDLAFLIGDAADRT